MFFLLLRTALYWIQYRREYMFGWAKKVRPKKKSSLSSAHKFLLRKTTILRGQA